MKYEIKVQLALADFENIGCMLVGLEMAAQYIDKATIYECLDISDGSLFKIAQEHERALIDLYTAILLFQTSAMLFYRKNTFGKCYATFLTIP